MMAEQVCRRFSLAEMQSATGDFSDARVIGRGGFGKVYKGLLDDDTLIVAVKRLASNSNQGAQEFAMEMETLSKLRHRNLVSLIGYCNEEGEMILVYEYMPNGTLADHLHKNNHNLTWNQRLTICIGAARALDYLHTGSSVIHRDFKPANILLDKNFTAKVSDFGLAKNLSADDLESHVSASVKGSFGYFDPFYFVSGRLTKASDTYAFGVVLLEILSGRKAIAGNLGEGEPCLTIWAQEKIRKGKFLDIVDSNLRAEISGDCLKTFVGVVKRCLHYEPKKRLSMTEAVAQLVIALEQQDRKGSSRKLQFPSFNPFWNRVTPSVAKLNVRESFGDLAIQLEEMKKITGNFSSYNWISNGITGGSIFRGVLKTGKVVAIKRRYKKLPDQEFLEQVTLSSSLKHENVMELLGYCVDDGRQMLVYEFSKRGSLHDIFHGRQGPMVLPKNPGPVLSWTKRIEIAVGVAKGLLYFHENSLFHGNIKSGNVLLFDNEITKICDSHVSTKCPCERGRNWEESLDWDCGNHPPEYVLQNPRHDFKPIDEEDSGFSREGDVYNFGILLLELLTGRKSSDLKKKMPEFNESNLQDSVDARLRRDYPPKAAAKVVKVATLCVSRSAADRPKMSAVLEALQIAALYF